jgi:WD40 repeat protein
VSFIAEACRGLAREGKDTNPFKEILVLKALPGQSARFDRIRDGVCQIFIFLRRKPRGKVNTTSIHLGVDYVASAFLYLEGLETSLYLYTLDTFSRKVPSQCRCFPFHQIDTAFSVAFSPDGDRIISGSWDHSVRVWDGKTGEQLRELKGHTDTVNSVTFSPDGDRIISGSWDHSVRVWDAKTGEQLRELKGHTDAVCSVAFSPDGDRIVSGSCDHVCAGVGYENR